MALKTYKIPPKYKLVSTIIDPILLWLAAFFRNKAANEPKTVINSSNKYNAPLLLITTANKKNSK